MYENFINWTLTVNWHPIRVEVSYIFIIAVIGFMFWTNRNDPPPPPRSGRKRKRRSDQLNA